MNYITLVKPQDEDLLSLHYTAIRKADDSANIFYLSKEEIKTPRGSINLTGLDGSESGLNELIKFLNIVKVIMQNFGNEVCLISPSTVLCNSPASPILKREADLLLFLENTNEGFNKSVIVFNMEVIQSVQNLINRGYYDLFNRPILGIFATLASLATDPKRIKVCSLVLPSNNRALGGYFNPIFFTEPEYIRDIYLFVDCRSDNFLLPYRLAMLKQNLIIKRAMSLCLRAWKKN